MVASRAATPEAYLAELAPDRAAFVARLRALVNANLPAGYEERMNWGMISWEVPLSLHPETPDGQPAAFAALAAQKNFTALYLNCVYGSEERVERLKHGFAAAGKRLDMGKSCLRFKRPEDVAEDAIAEAIRSMPVARFIGERSRGSAR